VERNYPALPVLANHDNMATQKPESEDSVKSKAAEYALIINKAFPDGFNDGTPVTEQDLLPVFRAPLDQQDTLVKGLISSKNAMTTGQMVAEGGAIATEMGVGIGAQVVGAGNPVVSAGGGLAGNVAAQAIRMKAGLQDEINKGEAMAAAASAAVPFSPFAKGASAAKTLFSNLVSNELGFVLSEFIRTPIDQGRLPSKEELTNPVAQGFALGGASIAGAGVLYGERQRNLDLLRESGVDTKKMPQSILTKMPWAVKSDVLKAATNIDYRQQFTESLDGIGKNVKEWLVPVSTNAEVAELIRPYVGKLDKLGTELKVAKQQADELLEQSAKASSDLNITPDEKLTIYSAASTAVNTELAKKMEAINYLVIGAAPASNPAILANLWSQTVKGLFEKQRKVTDAVYNAVGLKQTDLLVNADELADKVQQGLSGFGERESVSKIVQFIRNSAQLDEFMDSKGKLVKVPKAGDNIDNGRLMEMRTSINKQLNPDKSRPNVDDRIINTAYNIIREERLNAAAVKGIDPKKLADADKIYAKFMGLRNDKFAASLLDPETSDKTMEGISEQVITGKLQSMENAFAFAKEIGPEAESSLRSVMQQTIKETLINKAFQASGLNNKSFHQNLADSVLKANQYLRQSKNLFDFNIGFGSSEEIKRWNYAFNLLDPKNLTEKDLRSLFADPIFQKALSNGDGEVVKVRTAKKVYANLIKKQRQEEAVGIEQTYARRKLNADKLDKAAKDAKNTFDDVKAAYEAAEKDPFTLYLFQKGKFGVTDKVGEGASDYANMIFQSGPAEAKLFMNALKKSNPVGHDLVLRELRTNAFNVVTEDLAAKGSYSNDFSRITAEFNNPNPNAKIKVLRELSTPEEWNAFSKTARVADILTKHRELGKLSNVDSVYADVFGVLVGANALASGGFASGQLARNFAQRVIDTVQQVGFGTWAHILGDRFIANNLAKVISRANTFQQLYNPLQQYNMSKNTPDIYDMFVNLSDDPKEAAYYRAKLESEAADAIYTQNAP